MSVLVEAVAIAALRAYLLRKLPAKISALNAANFVTLPATLPGPYTIPDKGGTGFCPLKLTVLVSDNGNAVSFTISVTAGVRTAQQVANDINANAAVIASGLLNATVDTLGRLLLVLTLPVSSTNMVRLDADNWDPAFTQSINNKFGWDRGGEKVVATALYPPRYGQFVDGWPTMPSFGPVGAINLVIGDRTSAPIEPGPRRDEYSVELELVILRAEPESQNTGSDKSGINRAVQAVRELLVANDGRQLGQEQGGAVKLVEEAQTSIRGQPIQFANMAGIQFDAALMNLRLKVFEQQG